MPKGILTRLIVMLHRYIYESKYWRSGVLLKFDNARAMVREKYFDKKIEIIVVGRDKKQLLGIIRKTINDINNMFPDLKMTEMVPCYCSSCAQARKSPSPDKQPCYFELNQLIRRLKSRVIEIQCENSYEIMNIPLLLGDIIFIDTHPTSPYRMGVFKEYWSSIYSLEESKEKHGFSQNIIFKDSKINIEQFAPSETSSLESTHINHISAPEKKPWYKTIWAIIGGIVLLLGGIWSIIQISESKRFEQFMAYRTKYRAVSDPNAQTDPNAAKQTSNLIKDKFKSLPDLNSPNATSTP